uniref:Uncharacterized protein n=1 Tax=Physcomitrium patens TaxID=3218 RepID=A0A2K1JU16_PHYPA|nr:hypothetical protein PHYPA_014795 [Physcomitrium patens]
MGVVLGWYIPSQNAPAHHIDCTSFVLIVRGLVGNLFSFESCCKLLDQSVGGIRF